MVDLKICRICLSKGVKMYDLFQYHLKQYFEEVMGKKMNEDDGLPLYFCYECAAMLHKFHKFKEKCYTGEKVLQEMKWRGPITLSTTSPVQRQGNNLQSTIGLIVISERVRTCIVRHKSTRARYKSPVTKTKKDEIPAVEDPSSSASYSDSENSVDAETKNEMTNVNLENIIKHEVIYKHTDITVEKKVNINFEKVNIDEKATPDFEDDRMFSDDEELNTESTNDVKQNEIQEEDDDILAVVEEKINDIVEESNDNIKKDTNKKQKHTIEKKEKRDKKITKKQKNKKFEVRDKPPYNYLDPKHWLKINLSEKEAWEEFNAKAQDQKYLSAVYRCNDCYKSFSEEDMMIRHFKLRHSESLGPLECRFCKMRFKMKWQLTKHLTKHFTNYKCLRCEVVCPLSTSAIFHNAYHNGVTQKCKYCEAEFSHQSTYYSHLRTHRSEHVCTQCGASFVSVAGLNMHKKSMHVDTVINLEEERNMYCERCEIKFETRKAYEEHVYHSAKHTEGIEHLVGDTPGPSLLKRIPRNRNQPRVTTPCTVCKITFPSIGAYEKHRIAKHKGERVPKQGQTHVCEICGVTLKLTSMPSHQRSHRKEKLFKCIACDKRFTTKLSMERHQVTHTGEKPFQCTLCDKRFTQRGSVSLHYRTVHLKEPHPKRNRSKKIEIQPDPEFLEKILMKT